MSEWAPELSQPRQRPREFKWYWHKPTGDFHFWEMTNPENMNHDPVIEKRYPDFQWKDFHSGYAQAWPGKAPEWRWYGNVDDLPYEADDLVQQHLQNALQEATGSPQRAQNGLGGSQVASSRQRLSMPYDNNTWYHVTERSNLPNIAQQGLQGRAEVGTGAWHDYPVEDMGVYLWPNAAHAYSYAHQHGPGGQKDLEALRAQKPLGWEPNSRQVWHDPVVLRVRDIDRANLAPDHEMMDNYLEGLSDRIEEHNSGQWDNPYQEWEEPLNTWLQSYMRKHPAPGWQENGAHQQWYIDLLRAMPPDWRHNIAQQISTASNDSVMHLGPVHPSQIDVGHLNEMPVEYEDLSDRFHGDHPEWANGPGEDDDEDEWYENHDQALNDWADQQGEWIDPEEAKHVRQYGGMEDFDDEFGDKYKWTPLLGQTISKVANEDRIIYHTGGGNSGIEYGSQEGRIPYLYDADRDLLHWGEEQQWHYDLRPNVEKWLAAQGLPPYAGTFIPGAIRPWSNGTMAHAVYDRYLPPNADQAHEIRNRLEQLVGHPVLEHFTPDSIMNQPWQTTTDDWLPKLGADSWKQQYHYRAASPDAKRMCETCSAFQGGKCHMFYQSNVEPEMVCDEWSSTWAPKTGSDWMADSADSWHGPGSVREFEVDVPGEAPGMGGIGHIPGEQNTLFRSPCWCDIGPTTPHEWSPICENGMHPTLQHEASITANPDHWVWLDGHVAFGGDHHDIAARLTREIGYDPNHSRYISNMIARGLQPEGHNIAVGTLKGGYPHIWTSTVDRNAVWDDVARSREEQMQKVASMPWKFDLMRAVNQASYLYGHTFWSGTPEYHQRMLQKYPEFTNPNYEEWEAEKFQRDVPRGEEPHQWTNRYPEWEQAQLAQNPIDMDDPNAITPTDESKNRLMGLQFQEQPKTLVDKANSLTEALKGMPPMNVEGDVQRAIFTAMVEVHNGMPERAYDELFRAGLNEDEISYVMQDIRRAVNGFKNSDYFKTASESDDWNPAVQPEGNWFKWGFNPEHGALVWPVNGGSDGDKNDMQAGKSHIDYMNTHWDRVHPDGSRRYPFFEGDESGVIFHDPNTGQAFVTQYPRGTKDVNENMFPYIEGELRKHVPDAQLVWPDRPTYNTRTARYYHVAPRKHRDSILQQGLLPMYDMQDFVPEDKRLLWLWNNADTARQYASPEHSWGGSLGDNDLWEIDPEGIEVEPDRDRMHEHAVQTRRPIPPERLKLVQE